MIDIGSKSRELLVGIFGTMDFGELAVDGFFLISGYLVCQSMVTSKSTFSYIMKRILRIYPAFVVIWIISILIFTPLAGYGSLIAHLTPHDLMRMLAKMFALSQPHVEGVYFTQHNQTLNGSMWTIRYEFICYLIIPFIALIGLNKKNSLCACALLIALYMFTRLTGYNLKTEFPFPLDLNKLSRLSSAFLIGICYFQFRESIIWSNKLTIACTVLFIAFMFHPLFSELGVFIFGSYLLFNFALNYNNSQLQKIGRENDISYGVYLYAWPFQSLVIQQYPAINPWSLTLITIIFSSIAGYFSWIWVEKPFMGMKKRFI